MKTSFIKSNIKAKSKFLFSLLTLFFAQQGYAQNPLFNWAGPDSANVNSFGRGICTDGDGNVIIIGSFDGAVYDAGGGAPESADLVNTLATRNDVFISKYAADGTHIKSVSFGSASTAFNDGLGEGITSDEQNNIYVIGKIDGGAGIDLDPGPGVTLSAPAIGAGRGDVFVSKYDDNLDLVWAFSIPGANFDAGNGIAVDGNGYVYITGMFGTFGGPTDFDPSTGILNLTPTGGNPYGDIFVAKYNGNDMPSDPTFFQWAFNVGGNVTGTLFAQRGTSICVDSQGMVYVTGAFHCPVATPVDFDPNGSHPSAMLLSAGSRDIFVAKYDGNLTTPQDPGFFQWAFNIGGAGEDVGWSIKTDDEDNVIVTGEFSGTAIDFNPLGTAIPLTSNGTDLFLAKYDGLTGASLWAFKVGGTDAGANHDIGYSLSIDNCHNVYITGTFTGTADFNPLGTAVNLTSGGSDDIFVARYDESGINEWAFRIANALNSSGFGITADENGNIYTTGFYRTTTDFDPAPPPGTTTLPAGGTNHTFVAAYHEDDLPTIDASSSTICEGQSTTLSVLSGNLYGANEWQWYEGSCGGTPVGTGTTLDVFPIATTTYYAGASGGCVSTGVCASITITVLPQPIADAGIDQTIQIPQCALLNGSASGGTPGYTYSWSPGGAGQNISACPSAAGSYDYELTVTDNNGCTNTDIVTVNAIECLYELPDQQILCSGGTFCLPLNAGLPVPSGIIGMDICVTYDPAVMTPAGSGTGIATLGPVVTNGGTANSYISFDNIAGELNISIYYEGSSPFTEEFDQVAGNIVCIPFNLIAGTGPIVTSYSICSIDEGMLVGVNAGCIPVPATLTVTNDFDLAGTVQYQATPNLLTGGTGEVPTSISAADITCTLVGPVTQTGFFGEFNVDVTGTSNFNVSRDIQGDYGFPVSPVMISLINGQDALRANQIATKDATYIPSVYDIIAADVNLDGLVRANDVTLILQRAVISIPEFPQAWNYVGGLPPAPGDLSLDWLFFDDTRLISDADFTIDINYPYPSGTGYSRDLIPDLFNNCLTTPLITTGSCITTPDVNIQAVLVGDVESSWLPGDASYAKSGDLDKIIYYDLHNAIDQSGNLLVPVYVSSDIDVNAIDFTINYNQNTITVIGASKSGNAESAAITYNWNNYQTDILLLSSYTTSPIAQGTSSPLFYIEINSTDLLNLEADFGGNVVSYLNGIEVSSVVIPRSGAVNIEMAGSDQATTIYPNPSNGSFTLTIPQINSTTTIRIVDLQGKEVFYTTTENQVNQINLENVESGVYVVQITNSSGSQNKRIVIQ